MSSNGKKTPFYEKHQSAGGKMVNYNGWLLPVQYGAGLVEEVRAARNKAVIFDVSHMGEITVTGSDSEQYLQRVLTNDISNLADSAISYSPVCYPEGGVVDDILVYRIERDSYLLVVNAANTEKDFTWLSDNVFGDVELNNVTDRYAQLALQGPSSLVIMNRLSSEPLDHIKYYHFNPKVSLDGVNCLVSRTGYTGEDGFEIYCHSADGEKLWDLLWENGREFELAAAGLGARDVLRLEAAMPLYGHELSREISPLQARLDRFIAFNKNESFIGKEALLKQKRSGITHMLYGLEMLERAVPREGYPVLSGDDEIGWVSSGSYSPTLDQFIALAFLDPLKVESGGLRVKVRNRVYRTRVTKIPFYRREK